MSNAGRGNDKSDDHHNKEIKLARIAEMEAAAKKYGTRFLLMHQSALLPDTAPADAARHGKLYTPDEAREWLNSNCNNSSKTMFVQVIVGDDDKPLMPGTVERAKQTYAKLKAGGKGNWTKG